MARVTTLIAALIVTMLLGGCLPEVTTPVVGGGSVIGGGGSGSDGDGGSSGGSGGGSSGGGSGSGGSSGGSSGGGSGDGDTAGGDPGSGGTGADPGSGGTGAVASVGSVDGFGSVIVNGVRYDDTTATLSLEDSSALALGMVVRVTGSIGAGGTTGVAQSIEAGIEIIGQVSAVDTASAQFTVMGTVVQTSTQTVWANIAGLPGLSAGAAVKVSGLWVDGVMQATRVEDAGVISQHQVTGEVTALDTGAQTFRLGGLTVTYAMSTFQGMSASDLANGRLLRVRGTSPPVAGVFAATRIKGWLTSGDRSHGGNVHIRGTVHGFVDLSSFKVLDVPVKADGNGVQFSASSSNVGNGTDIQIRGRWSNGTLVAQRVTILSGPGGTPVVYTLNGSVGSFSSLASFRVKGSRVDASGPSVVFVNGSPGDLSNGDKVEVSGQQIVNDVLKATQVTFLP